MTDHNLEHKKLEQKSLALAHLALAHPALTHLELTQEELDQLIQGVSPLMAETGSALINLKTLSDDDLDNLLSDIQAEQEHRKWQRIQKILTQYFFPLSIPDLHRVQDLISMEIQKREGSPLDYPGNGSQKDVLTGQFGSDWMKRSASTTEVETIDVEVSS
jgi:DNA polymerase III delta subunit